MPTNTVTMRAGRSVPGFRPEVDDAKGTGKTVLLLLSEMPFRDVAISSLTSLTVIRIVRPNLNNTPESDP
jgi:hypothetical protein